MLLLVSACSSELSPESVLLSRRLAVANSAPQQIVITAPPDRAVAITIAGQGVDVQARMMIGESTVGPDTDAPNRRMGVETLLVEAGHSGVIWLWVQRNDHPGARGYADVHAVILPDATEADRNRLRANRLEAQASMDFSDSSTWQRSAGSFGAAAKLYSQNNQRLQEGLATLHAAGARYHRHSDWAGAADFAEKATKLLEQSGEAAYAAYAMRLEGAALDQLANQSNLGSVRRSRVLRRARTLLTDSHRRFLELGDSYEAAYALNYRGVSYQVAGERDLARRDFLSALNLFESVGDAPAQALSLQSLALQSVEDGRLRDAIREFDDALALIPRAEEPENFAHTLNNSALPLRAMGRFDEAIARYHEAGEILHGLGDRNGEARALHGLGITLLHAGENDRAKDMLETAIRLRGETGARREQAISLLALGDLYRKAGQIERAISLDKEALGHMSAAHDLAQARLALGRAYAAAGQWSKAFGMLASILDLDLPASHHYVALASAELGRLEAASGRTDVARSHFDRALKILSGNGSDLEHARVLIQRADSRLKNLDLDGALLDSRAAVTQLDDIGVQSLQLEERATFRASYRTASEVQISALLRQAEVANSSLMPALAISDRGRVNSIAWSPMLPDDGAEQLRTLYDQLSGLRMQLDRLRIAPSPNSSRIAELTRELDRVRREASRLAGRGVTQPPRTGNPTHSPGAVNRLAHIAPGAVIAEFFIGQSQAWLFEVRRNVVVAHAIGDARVIEDLARSIRVAWEDRGVERSAVQQAQLRLCELLFGKLGPLSTDTDLWLIPDGVLHLLPLAVLAREQFQNLPSGGIHLSSSLASVPGDLPSQGPNVDRLLAVVADPIYARDDPRIGLVPGPNVRGISGEESTQGARGAASLARLPSADLEVRAIAAIAGTDSGTILLTGEMATRQAIAKSALGRYRIVHFATHGFADRTDPALATLALSRFDADGNPLDGDIHSFEISRWRLGADLVVLSACDTALGKEIAGELPLSLAQAFLQSGAKSVLATLWQVPDTSTAHLMGAFYREHLINKRTPAAALEFAQESVRNVPRWADPYYWAGFQLMTNSRTEAGNNDVN